MKTSDDIDVNIIDGIVEKKGRGPDAVITILRAIQETHNYLPEAALRRVCETTEITPASIAGVSTFYSGFRLQPAGRHIISVCIGTACHIKGGERVFTAFKQHLDIPDNGDTDTDRLFTVEKAACLGCCMLAPAVRIDNITYGFLDTQKVPRVIKDFLDSQEQDALERIHDDQGHGDKSHGGNIHGNKSPGGNIHGGKNGTPKAYTSGEIRMCACSSCLAAGAGKVFKEFQRQISSAGMPVKIKDVGCTGISYEAPFVEILLPDKNAFRYGRIQPRDVGSILDSHFRPAGIKRRVVRAASRLLENLLTDELWEPVTRYSVDLRHGPDSLYWGRQKHIVTEHCGSLDPLDLEGYIKLGGFEGLDKCISGMPPGEIIDKIEKSGLRGRGGGGFPTGRKWALVHAAGGDARYIICNGDEGDPGAFMDRMILESFPFRVIEGMAIAAHAVGASEGYIYIRAEYPLAIHRIKKALRLCVEHGITGNKISGPKESSKGFHIKLVEGAGAFVSGEETALIAAIEGRRGMPRFRPPYPDSRGLWGLPTLVNNVETFAVVPWIMRNGPENFAGIGTESSKGTKTFALAGKIVRGGLVEVPMGITLREIVYEIGGGIQGGKALKAVQIGGPSGGCVPASLADTVVDYDALVNAGAIMGSGGLVVLDETDCMVDIARYFMAFTQAESCGKCTCCRIGTKCMLDILERFCRGEGEDSDLEELEHLAEITKRGSLCGLGRTAPNPVLSTIKHFRGEYIEHIHGRCPAKKCKDLITFRITDDCIGCTRCSQRCPAEAIPMKPYARHEIDQEKCTKCGTCVTVCAVDAVIIE